MTVAAILKHKGYEIASVEPSTTVGDLVQTLSKRRIGAVVVLDKAGQLQGIVSERDIIHALAASGTGVLDMTTDQIMTRNVHTATPQTTVPEAMTIMTERRFRHIPVVDNGALVGLISIGDVVKARITQQEHEVDSLKAYVAGGA